MADPRVSVICIFLNEERFLSQAIESVLAQQFRDFELLLVDDGSTDASSRIARSFAEAHPGQVRYLDHPAHANRGMAASRNAGAAEARGEFLAFLDGDDRWRPQKLGEQVAILDDEPSCGMVCGTVNYWHSWEEGDDRLVPTGDRQDQSLRPPETSLHLYPLGECAAPCPSDVMVRTSLHQLIGGFEEDAVDHSQFYEDQFYFAKVYLNSPVWFSSHVWIDYRQHDQSCVAQLMRTGRYLEVRAAFLDWYAAYLRSLSFEGKSAVARALTRVRWRIAHPQAARAERKLRRLAASGYRLARNLRRTLPAT